MEAPSMASTPVPPIEERRSPSFFQKYKFTIISLVILIVALIPLILLTKMHKNPQQAPQQMTENTATPTPALTQDNAQPTLDATDQNIQQSINQANAEINAANQVDSSQDSTAGL